MVGDLDSAEILSFETLLGRGVSSFARDAVQDLTYRLAMLKPTANRSSTPQKRNLGRRLPGLSVNLLSSCTWRVLPRENSRGFRFIGRIVETSDTTFFLSSSRHRCCRGLTFVGRVYRCQNESSVLPSDSSLSRRRQTGNFPGPTFSLLGYRQGS